MNRLELLCLIPIIAFSIIACSCGSTKNDVITSTSATLIETITAEENESKSEQELTDLTIQAVKNLNQKSNLGDYQLLNPLPYPMEIPGSGNMNDGRDRFNCFPYADGYYITRVFLFSNDTDVFGISNGQTEDDADAVLQSEGFQKLSAEEAANLFLAEETGIAYAKYDITVVFRISSETKLIDEKTVVININDDITY